MTAFHVKEIWRYPVKSMQGEMLEQCVLRENGIPLDRGWAVRDEERQQITGAKRLPGLLLCSARYISGTSAGAVPHVEITLPDGATVRSDALADANEALTRALGTKITLWPLQPGENKEHYRQKLGPSETPLGELRKVFGLAADEPLPDLSKFPPALLRELTEFVAPLGTYFDAYPVDVLSEASLRHLKKLTPDSAIDLCRFRPNFLIADDGGLETNVEESWVGSEIGLGDARLKIATGAPRCIMTTRSQAGLPQDNAILRTIIREMKHCFSVYADVARTGAVRVGDALTV